MVKVRSQLSVMHNMSIAKKSNSWTMDETHIFQLLMTNSQWVVCMEIFPYIINFQRELNYLNWCKIDD